MEKTMDSETQRPPLLIRRERTVRVGVGGEGIP